MKTSFFSRIHWKSFFLGFAIAMLVTLIFEWNDLKKGFSEGYNSVKTENAK
jgi:hypothetical protein